MTGSRVHLTSGKHLDVSEDAETAAKHLWTTYESSPLRAGPAEGFATLTDGERTYRVNPQAVLYIEDVPQYRRTSR